MKNKEMCYFFCISVIKSPSNFAEIFSEHIDSEDAFTTPIGKASRGNRNTGNSYVLTEGGCSCSFIGKSHNKAERASLNIIVGIKRLLEQAPIVSILIHNYRGDWRDEEVTAKCKKSITLEQFISAFPNLDEDVRYIIST